MPPRTPFPTRQREEHFGDCDGVAVQCPGSSCAARECEASCYLLPTMPVRFSGAGDYADLDRACGGNAKGTPHWAVFSLP